MIGQSNSNRLRKLQPNQWHLNFRLFKLLYDINLTNHIKALDMKDYDARYESG